MDITREEYKLLKRFYKTESIIVDNEISYFLIKKDLIEPKSCTYKREGICEPSEELVITNKGKIAYENYREKIISVRRANIQSWIAIAISIGSLAVSIIALL